MLILRVGTTSFFRDGNESAELRKRCINVEIARSARDALELLRLYDYDIVLLDLNLTDMPAHEAVRMARAAGIMTPAIILAAAATSQTKTKALDQGADDFIVTPCDPEEVMARIRAVVRRSQGHSRSTLRLGTVELSLERRELRIAGKKLPISRREFAVLELLFLKQGTILNKTAFLNHLYSTSDEPEMKTIDVIVCRLRKKLVTAGAPNLIDTVWGCGYILRDPAEDVDAIGTPELTQMRPAMV